MALKGIVCTMFDVLQEHVDRVALAFLLSDFATLVALVGVLQYYLFKLPLFQSLVWQAYISCHPSEARWIRNEKSPRMHDMSSSFLRTTGLNMIVFQIYYKQNFQHGGSMNQHAFVMSLVWIFFNTFVLWSFFGILMKIKSCNCETGIALAENWEDGCLLPSCCVGPIIRKLDALFKCLTIEVSRPDQYHQLLEVQQTQQGEEADMDDEKPGSIRNIYMDISRPFRLCIVFFLCQLGLVTYYVYALNDDKDSHKLKNVSALKWMIGVLLTIMAADSGKEEGKDEAGSKFMSDFWKTLFKDTVDKPFFSKEPRLNNLQFWLIPLSLYNEWKIRRILDFFVNNVCRTILLGTSPIILCVEEPLDFIKDVLAVFFIIALDDYDDAKSWEEVVNRFTQVGLALPHKGVSFTDSEGDKVRFQISAKGKFEAWVNQSQRRGGADQFKREVADITQVKFSGHTMTVNNIGVTTVNEGEEDKIEQVKRLYELNESKKNLINILNRLKL